MIKDTILIHCTATPEGREVSAAELNLWHKSARFEPYINAETGVRTYAGYHLLIHLDGSCERLRPDNVRGQHCATGNMNSRAIGICYVGGCDKSEQPKDTRTEAQKHTLISILRNYRKDNPQIQILGHRDIPGVKKACPSFNAKNEYKEL